MFRFASLISALVVVIGSATPGLSQDATAGEAVFNKCKACHQIGADAKNGVGPRLAGVIGRPAGSVDGYKYSKDLAAAGEKGLVWTEELVADFVTDPNGFLQAYLDDPKIKSKMSFKLSDEKQRQDVAAYLAKTTDTSTDAAAAQPEATPEETRTVEEVIDDQVFTEEFLADPAHIETGRDIWFAQCTHCHGFKAYPGKAPKLKAGKYKPEFVFKRVYKGFKKMPAWRDSYSIDEIRAIVAYVKSPGFSP